MNTQEIINKEQQYLVQSYKRPNFVLERGEGVYLFDTEGRRFLDMVAGIAVNALGYSDPGVTEVIREHAGGLLHVSNLFHTAAQTLMAEKLIRSSFADRLFFANSGTEAVEGAFKFARKWARSSSGNADKYEIVAFSNAFHGRSMGALAATANAKYREPFTPLIGGVHFGEYNDLERAAALIGPNTAAVIIEPVQGEGGITPASTAFLSGLRRLCDEHGALLIFDEIQCGMGRTGTLWAHEAVDVNPDLMVIAKPLGGGLPIGAILLTQRVADVIVVGDHGSTFAGGPFITAVASYVFDRVSDPAFLDHVKEVGNYLGEQLSELAGDFPIIREVRGRGLMWGIELDESLPVANVVAAAPEQGLILVGAGRNTIRLLPPLIIQQAEVDEFIIKIRQLLKHATQEG
ncbi:MAG: aspartate aminotransferase family protein [Ardenticatenales bacterium]|nr:aspartate aminotransferase family protein [Ardenticatenales bacterium]